MSAFVIGYDPGGNDAHGLAILEVRAENNRWSPISLQITPESSLQETVARLTDKCRDGRIVAAGIDTLTKWNSGPGGWRYADLWLRKKYPSVAKCIVSPNSILGSMAVNGAAFLTLFAHRFESDETMITEAHPKVCFFALTGKKPVWRDSKSEMTAWLVKELGFDTTPTLCNNKKDNCFDAGVALLAALRGINRDWTTDPHALQREGKDESVQFIGKTYYWWPELRGLENRINQVA